MNNNLSNRIKRFGEEAILFLIVLGMMGLVALMFFTQLFK